jgi:hypothetical protein
MIENIHGLNDDDPIKAENDFLKMKLMLENGAQFGESTLELPAEIENRFLKNMIEFESQLAKQKTIKLFEKIGKPGKFGPVDNIADENIKQAWEELSAYLDEHDICLSVCSPNVTDRELYRFTIEELFECDIDDINIPGLMFGFIYDEFHPDHAYNNARSAKADCISAILGKQPLNGNFLFMSEGLQLNEHYPISFEKFNEIINRFKASYDDLQIDQILEGQCTIANENSIADGSYKLKATIGNESQILEGKWQVHFALHKEYGYWQVNNIQIGGIKF